MMLHLATLLAIATMPTGATEGASVPVQTTDSMGDYKPDLWLPSGADGRGKARRRGQHSPGTRAKKRWKARRRGR